MMKTLLTETGWVEKYSLSLCQQWAPSYPFLLSNCPNWKIISRSFPEEKKRELKLLQIIFHSSILDNFPPSSEFQICQFWFQISWICFQKVLSSSYERCSRSIFHPQDLLAWSRMVTFQTRPPALCLLFKVDHYPLPWNNVWLLPNERKQVALVMLIFLNSQNIITLARAKKTVLMKDIETWYVAFSKICWWKRGRPYFRDRKFVL